MACPQINSINIFYQVILISRKQAERLLVNSSIRYKYLF